MRLFLARCGSKFQMQVREKKRWRSRRRRRRVKGRDDELVEFAANFKGGGITRRIGSKGHRARSRVRSRTRASGERAQRCNLQDEGAYRSTKQLSSQRAREERWEGRGGLRGETSVLSEHKGVAPAPVVLPSPREYSPPFFTIYRWLRRQQRW